MIDIHEKIKLFKMQQSLAATDESDEKKNVQNFEFYKRISDDVPLVI